MKYVNSLAQVILNRVFIALLCITSIAACVTDPELYSEQSPAIEQTRDLADLDLDGVINERDLCADSPYDAVIDNDGCPTLTGRPKVKYRVIHFGFDKYSLSTREYKRVLEMADFLKKFTETSLYLIGDTSEEGSDSYNQALAQRRINSVLDVLMKQGINSERFKQEIYSFKNHIPDELKGRNRRMIAVLQWPDDFKDYEVKWNIFSEINKESLND
jgi:outer membrane protein OmpA-like peptidoglycan-associated protein